MDWIQIYTLSMLSISLLMSANMHGKPKDGEHNFWFAAFGLVLSLPWFGRVFGWW